MPPPDQEEQAVKPSSRCRGSTAEDDKSETEEKKEGEDEEPSNLQLAYEMLQLATRGKS